jgi:hypothetical protein
MLENPRKIIQEILKEQKRRNVVFSNAENRLY